VGYVSIVGLVGVFFGVALIAWALENRRRTTHPVSAGYQADIEFPHDEPCELYDNALSLCSMKTRVCLAELRIPYKSHHINLIETGCCENIRPWLLHVNPEHGPDRQSLGCVQALAPPTQPGAPERIRKQSSAGSYKRSGRSRAVRIACDHPRR